MHLGLMFWSGLDWGLALVPVAHQHFPVTSKPPHAPRRVLVGHCFTILKDSWHTPGKGPPRLFPHAHGALYLWGLFTWLFFRGAP